MALQMSNSFRQNYVCAMALNSVLALILLHVMYTASETLALSLSLSLSLSCSCNVSHVLSRIAAKIHVPQT